MAKTPPKAMRRVNEMHIAFARSTRSFIGDGPLYKN
jgi:hypothetical protein